MGSITNYLACPQCGGILAETLYYKCGEEYSHCERCGRVETVTIKKDSEGCGIKDDDGKWVYEHHLHPGLGMIRIAFKNGVFQLNAIRQEYGPIEELKDKVLKAIHEDDSIIKENCFIGIWDAERKEVVSFYGELPPSFESCMSDDLENSTDSSKKGGDQ